MVAESFVSFTSLLETRTEVSFSGSQSSYQVHTGHYTQESFHTDSANIDRALDALGKFVDEFTKDEYEGVVKA